MIFPEVRIYQPDSFEDFRGELYTLFKQDDHELVFNHDKVSITW
jgi:dTDP-4-dehydrorhamnose 3,5-epimerase-like enzyme